MRRPLRLGLIGTGVAARELYLPAFKELKGKVQVVACANRRRDKAEAFARLVGAKTVTDNAEELIALDEVEAVMISLPINVQPNYVLASLRASKPVLSEKPVAPSVREGKKLLVAAGRLKVPWCVAENFAFMSHAERLISWATSGRLGEVRLVQVLQLTKMDKTNPYFSTSWRQAPAHVGGFILDAGVHVAHVVRRCLGMPSATRGFVAAYDPKLPPMDTAVAALRFRGGVVGTWTSCFSVNGDAPLLKLYGERANAELYWDRAVLWDKGKKERVYPCKRNSFSAEIEHFSDVVRRGAAPLVTPKDALLDLQLIESICRA